MISYGKQTIGQKDKKKVLEALNSDFLTQGSLVNNFESDLKEYFSSQYCTAVSSGTAALHLVGIALGWGKGDIVLTSPITFLASANCILYSGATPDFVDINPSTYTIDLDQLESKVKNYQSNGKNVKAVVAVDYAGHPCDWKGLGVLAQKYHFQLVNDNCHALGSKYFDAIDYGVKYADAVTHSYHPVKHITTGEGGAVLTNNSEIDKKVKILRSHGMIKNKSTKNLGPWYYEMHELGFNYRITDFQCALGISQLTKLEKFVLKRRRIAYRYDKAFENNKLLALPKQKSNIFHSYHLYPLLIDFDKSEVDKIQLFNLMKEKNILLQVHYIPIHTQPYYKKHFGYKENDFPNAIDFYNKEISLPIFPTLSLNNQEEIIDLINRFYS